MSEVDRALIVSDLGAYAVTFFEMGDPEAVVRAKLIAEWKSCDSPAGVFEDAAREISRLPQPTLEDAETTERKRPVRESLGVRSVAEQLVAALSARETLEALGKDLG